MSLVDALLLDPAPFEVWIALRSDGQKGSGTQADPFNGGTRLAEPVSASLTRDASDGTQKTAIVTVTSHPFVEYDVVTISGTATAFDGTFQIFGVTATAFKYKTTLALPASASGSAQEVIYRFDEVMRAVPPWMTVRIGPGLFETRGFDAVRFRDNRNSTWLIKRGQRILGAGVGLTTVKLMYATSNGGSFAFSSYYFGGGPDSDFLDGFELADLTVDCNLRQQLTDLVMNGAVTALGKHVRIRRVRTFDFGSNSGVEGFPIGSAGGDARFPEPVDCRIEDCIIESQNRNGLYGSSCFMFFSGEEPVTNAMMFHRACAIRNCYANCEYLDNPVSIASIGNIAGTHPNITAEITTRSNHNCVTDDWVVISGAKESGSSSTHFNGSFKVTKLSDTQFRITAHTTSASDIPTVPTGNMFVGRFSSHRRAVQQLEKESNTIAILTTYSPHNHKPGDMVFIWHTENPPAGTNFYYGRFLVTAVVSPFVLKYELKTGEVPTTSPTNPSAFIGPGTIVLSAGGGSESVVEGNIVFNGDGGGSYQDTYSARDITNRNNYYSDIGAGPTVGLASASPLKLGSSLVFNGTTATFHTQTNHGLSAGNQIIVRGALMSAWAGAEPSYANPYNGKFTLPAGTNPNTTSFSYTMLLTPPLNSGGSPVFGDVKTGSSLIRKTGAAQTAVLTAIAAHGLSNGQNVTIGGARVGNAYPAAFNGQKQITAVPSTTTLEYSIGNGSASDPDASGSPVFSTEQTASSLSGSGTVATFTAANPVGLFVGQIVKITGATGAGASAFNGTFRVASVSGSSFTYNMDTAYTGSASGSPSFTAFLSVTSIVRSDVYGNANSNGLYAKVTTTDNHRLKAGDTISIWGATVSGSFDNPYNGAFRVEIGDPGGPYITANSFLIALEYNPGADASGTISWASQNSTPLVREQSDSIVLGVFTTDKPASSGTVFNAGDLVSMFGAVANGSVRNGFNAVVRVQPNPTGRSFKFIISGSDPLGNGKGGAVCALAKATPLTVVGTVGTFRTELKHGFFAGQAVQIVPAVEPSTSADVPFIGFLVVNSVPSETSFILEYPTAPGSNSPPGYRFTARWQSVQTINENNVLELGQMWHPTSGYGPSSGFGCSGIVEILPQYTFRRVLIRDNIVRLLPGTSNPYAGAVGVASAENMLVEKNIIDLPNAEPMQSNTTKAAKYFNNVSPSGTTTRGKDGLTLVTYAELSTQIEDILFLCL